MDVFKLQPVKDFEKAQRLFGLKKQEKHGKFTNALLFCS